MKKLSQKILSIKDPKSGYKKKISVKEFELPNGMKDTFFIDEDKDSVQIFAITTEQKIVCVKQFRAGIEKEQFEPAGGSLEDKEKHLEAAIRELKEETSYEGNMTFMGALPYHPYSSGQRFMYMATDCEKSGKLDLDPNEFLTVVLFDIESFKEKLRKFEIRGADLAWACLDKLNLL